jgi:hypothetical protein
MDGQNEDQTSRRKFIGRAGLAGAAAAVATPAVASAVQTQTEFSPDQISKLEEIVKNFVTNAQGSNIQPLGPALALAGHGSHYNEANGVAPSKELPAAPSKESPPPKASPGSHK